jgi:hypothetical protein
VGQYRCAVDKSKWGDDNNTYLQQTAQNVNEICIQRVLILVTIQHDIDDACFSGAIASGLTQYFRIFLLNCSN